MPPTTSSNGQRTTRDNSRSLHAARAHGLRSDLPDKRPRYAYTAADLNRIGLRLSMPMATLAVGLGTQGTTVVNEMVGMARTEWGGLPSPFQYQLIDAAARPLGVDAQHFFQTGVAGAGTNTKRGRELFDEHYFDLRSNFRQQVDHLFEPDPEFPLQTPPRKALNFLVVGGNGGTSGGSLHRTIDLVHDIAQELEIQGPRVHVVLIGAEIALRDPTRQLTVEQQRVVRDTAANNLIKILGDLASPGLLTATRPDGTTFAVPASRRVWAITVVDQSNGTAQFATVAAFNTMLVQALLPLVFTEAGVYLRERYEDQDKLGVVQRSPCN